MLNGEIVRLPLHVALAGLDLQAARELCDTLIAAGRNEIVVDVSGVDEIDEEALELLSRALCLVGGRISLRGLTRHHFRMLRDLGAARAAGGTRTARTRRFAP